MWSVLAALLAMALLGHVALWVTLFNRVHSLPLPCGVIRLLEKFCLVAVLLIPALLAMATRGRWFAALADLATGLHHASLANGYLLLCWLALVRVIPGWLRSRWTPTAPAALLQNDTRVVDLAAVVGGKPVADRVAGALARLPGNEIFQLHVQRKELALARLPASLDGLTIAQLSDLHFTRHFDARFYHAVVDETLASRPDLVVITGDIVDHAGCIPWLSTTLGRLTAPWGVYYILGNHDQRVPDVGAVRRTLNQAGLVDLGSRWLLVSVHGVPVVLAGNERPWFSGPAQMEACPVAWEGGRVFRLLLAHSPDQIDWARRHDFDLVLAGHNHGGQVRLPLVGPVVCPSRYGVRYASGLFDEPPSLLHVTRGISGLHPLRWNCPPELPLIVLRAGGGDGRLHGVRERVALQ